MVDVDALLAAWMRRLKVQAARNLARRGTVRQQHPESANNNNKKKRIEWCNLVVMLRGRSHDGVSGCRGNLCQLRVERGLGVGSEWASVRLICSRTKLAQVSAADLVGCSSEAVL